MSHKNSKIGIVGVGRLGANLSRFLKQNEYNIAYVYDKDSNKAEVISFEIAAKSTRSLKEVAEHCDIIITAVQGGESMLDIFFNKGDNLLMTNTEIVFLNCTSASPLTHIKVENAAVKVGAEALECCLPKTIVKARKGEAYFLISGKKATFKKVKTVLDEMCDNYTYVGPAGEAAKINVIINMAITMNTAVLAETLALGNSLNIDPAILKTALSKTESNSAVLETDADNMQSGEHNSFYDCIESEKVSNLAKILAAEHNLTLPLLDITRSQFKKLVDNDMGALGKSAISKLTFKN